MPGVQEAERALERADEAFGRFGRKALHQLADAYERLIARAA